MADYDWFDRTPNEYEFRAAKWRPLGLQAVFEHSSTYTICGIKYYQCRRGCGTLVWNPEEHVKNVCPTFSPVASKD